MKYLHLLRPRQWYKNLVVFLPLIFSQYLFNTEDFLKVSLGFLALCLVSSANYIINDILDREKDKYHPEKCKRPIASGEISIPEALAMCIFLLFISTLLAYDLAPKFSFFVWSLFGLTTLYSVSLKNEPFADLLMIAVNFIVRAVSGAVIINRDISPWLVFCTFFLSLFLSTAKRESDLHYLKEKAAEHKPVLKYYTPELTRALMIIATTSLIISYAMYSFLSQYQHLLFSLPFALYCIFRYFYLAMQGSEIARHPEKGFKDIRLVLGGVGWAISIILLIYFNSIINFLLYNLTL